MPRTPVGQSTLSEKSVNGSAAEAALNVLLLFDDRETKGWAAGAYQQVCGLTGERGVRATWWNLSDFSHPGVLAGAVSMAIRADVLIVASRATEGLPFPFYVWVNSWLPHRRGRTGTLIGLLETSNADGSFRRNNPGSSRVKDFLTATARQAGLKLRLEERELATRELVEA